MSEPFDPPGEPWVRVSPKLATLRRLLSIGLGALVLVGLTVLAAMAATWLAVAVAVVGVGALAWGWVVVGRSVRSWGYAERADDLLVTRGVLNRQLVVVPVRPDAVRRRDRRAAGPPVRAGHRAAAHRGRRHRRADPGPGPRRGGPAPGPPGRPGRGRRRRCLTADRDGFRRLHPLTPFIRGWKIFAAAVAIALQQAYGDIGTGWLLSAIGASIPIGIAYGWFSWRNTHYRVGDDDLRLETGVLRKRSRRVRLDRLQAVDVVRPLVARALGLAELRLEVAGGGSSEAPLAYLSEDAAQRLRAELLARAAGLHHATPEAPEAVLLEVPLGRLVEATLRSVALIGMLVSLVCLVVVTVVTGEWSLLGFAVPFGLAVVPITVGTVVAALRVHGGRVAGRTPAPARAARDPVADRAAGPGAGGAGGRALAVALAGVVPGRGRRRRVRR